MPLSRGSGPGGHLVCFAAEPVRSRCKIMDRKEEEAAAVEPSRGLCDGRRGALHRLLQSPWLATAVLDAGRRSACFSLPIFIERPDVQTRCMSPFICPKTWRHPGRATAGLIDAFSWRCRGRLSIVSGLKLHAGPAGGRTVPEQRHRALCRAAIGARPWLTFALVMAIDNFPAALPSPASPWWLTCRA